MRNHRDPVRVVESPGNKGTRVRGLALARSIIISRKLASPSSPPPLPPSAPSLALALPFAAQRAGPGASPGAARRSPAASKRLAEKDGANRKEAALLRARRLRAVSSPARHDAALPELPPLERLDHLGGSAAPLLHRRVFAVGAPGASRVRPVVARMTVPATAPTTAATHAVRTWGGAGAVSSAAAQGVSAAAARRRWSVSGTPKVLPQRAPLPRQ